VLAGGPRKPDFPTTPNMIATEPSSLLAAVMQLILYASRAF
jgi:hypothetical protein